MNPYGALFSHPTDILITWILVILWLGLGTAVLSLRDVLRPAATPDLCWAASRSFFYLCALLAVVSIVGLVFLAWLRIESSLWSVWGLIWIINVIAVFQVLPVCCALLVGWALVERWRGRISKRPIFISIACPVGVILNVALCFALLFTLSGHK